MMISAQELCLGGRLAGVSLDLYPGEVVAICGPNGAGKSSLLQALAGLLPPASGSIALDGVPLAAMPARQRAQAIGFLPQGGQVAWDMDVQSLVALGRLPWGEHRPDEEAVVSALTAMDLGDLRTRPVSRLSGGERARAMLARVLAGEPRWILADEPLASLDLAHGLQLMQSLRAQAERGRGVALVMHDLAMAMNHATRVVVMHKGAVVVDAQPQAALCPDILAKVWGVRARWLGEEGGQALTFA
jgi:iron complex transport system ATP-binding protein